MQVGCYHKDDKEYPKLLKKTGKDAPKQIYFKCHSESADEESRSFANAQDDKGDAQDGKSNNFFDKKIFENCLAVVGSRRLTSYGKQAGEKLIGQIASQGITIVSGFMHGGDALAHKTAVKAGGRTIAVMPCGIDLIHPSYQEGLYNSILENNGLIISEYDGEMKPTLWTYPRRNRIIAGLSKAVLVLEAEEKSGTLITVNYARKFKRKVFALPGPITGSLSKGTNLLIKQGIAEMVTEANDVITDLAPKTKFFESLSPAQQAEQHAHAYDSKNLFSSQIVELLAKEPMNIDELSREMSVSSSELGVKLSIMEMRGEIILRGNKYYLKE